MQKTKIKAAKGYKLDEADRLELVRLLAKAGYAVRLGREKVGVKSAVEHFVEFWEAGAI